GMIDDSDFFIEKVDTTAGVYLNKEGKHRLSVQTRRVKIKDHQDRYFSVYRTANGPILNSLFPSVNNIPFISFKWSGYFPSDELKTFIELAQAQNWGDFEHALQTFGIPCQNFVYADRNGNIGYRLGGRVPIRSYANGLIPRRTWSLKNQWVEWVPFEEMPHILNPDSGLIVTANNRIAGKFPYYLSELWEPPYRAARIRELIRQVPKSGLETMQQIQKDSISLLTREIKPLILAALKGNPQQSQAAEDLLILLSNWNGEMSTEKIAPTVFETTQYFLIQNIFLDEMGKDLFHLFTDLPNFYLRVFVQVLKKKNSPWFDDVTTPQVETREGIIVKSFQEAITFLNHRLGSDVEDWRWGNLHQLELVHALGKVSFTKLIFNKGPFPLSGNGTTVNVASYKYADPFRVVAGPSMRFVVDWGAPGVYWSVLPGGNSGNFLSPFYSNQIQSWRKGKMKRVSLQWHKEWQKFILKPTQKFSNTSLTGSTLKYF
ncbi:MAG TPA: penicillin acylase family protein, partial [Caldithrix sp.]|nr:penicillin acylase family protein [Caldithrix sp.]